MKFLTKLKETIMITPATTIEPACRDQVNNCKELLAKSSKSFCTHTLMQDKCKDLVTKNQKEITILIKYHNIKIFGTLLQNLVVIARQQQRVLKLQQHLRQQPY